MINWVFSSFTDNLTNRAQLNKLVEITPAILRTLNNAFHVTTEEAFIKMQRNDLKTGDNS